MIVGVTGGTGFIGSALVKKHIALGDTVRVLSRRSGVDLFPGAVTLFNADLTGTVDKLIPFVDRLNVLYHCAAEIKNQSKMSSVHIAGTENLCAAAADRIDHWVQLSSVGVYGQRLKGVIDEKHSFSPAGIYEETKAVAEDVVKQGAARGGFTWSILRPSNVYGPKMSNASLFQLIASISKGLFFFIGKPGARANYIHVDNVVDALLLCGRNELAKGKIYNLNDSCCMEVLVGVVLDALGQKNLPLRVPVIAAKVIALFGCLLPGFPLTLSRIHALTSKCDYSIDRIRNELGYLHKVSIEEGLREVVTDWSHRVGGNHHF